MGKHDFVNKPDAKAIRLHENVQKCYFSIDLLVKVS